MIIVLTINNEPCEVEADPRRLLLKVLREDLGLMGTKCGCGEGECGACTVILNGRTVNSCLTTIGQAHGGYVTTIEGLAAGEKGQKILETFAEKGAVQCGFCTPGIAISTASLVDRRSEITDDEIRYGLSGHLCRCTGYVKIVDAVEATAASRLDLQQLRQADFRPISAAESAEFLRPRTLDEALDTMADTSRQWTVLAGGTDLYVKHENRIDTLSLLDISGIGELKGITVSESEVRIGAGTHFTDIVTSEFLRVQFPSLVQSASQIGGVQIQNMGTIGGNVANGSPAADIVPPLMTLDAVVELISRNGVESVPVEAFFNGLNSTVIKPGQLIKAIMIPLVRKNGAGVSFFDKLGTRKALAITKASLAFYGELDGGRFDRVRLAMGSVAENVIPAPDTAKILMSGELTKELLTRAADRLGSEARPIDDMFSTEAYCRQAIGGLLIRNLWQHLPD